MLAAKIQSQFHIETLKYYSSDNWLQKKRFSCFTKLQRLKNALWTFVCINCSSFRWNRSALVAELQRRNADWRQVNWKFSKDLKLTKKGEYTLKKKCIQSGFPLQKPKAFRRYTHLLFFQDGGNFEYFSTSQENVVHVLVEDYTIK